MLTRSFLLSLFAMLLCCYSMAQPSAEQTKATPDMLITWVTEQLQNPITDSALVYFKAHQSVQITEATNNKDLLAVAFRNLATWHLGSKTIDSTAYYFQEAKSIYNSLNKTKLLAETSLEMEDAYKQRASYSLALAQDFEALALYEELNDETGVASCYTRLCDLMYYQEKYADGAAYCQKAIDIQKRLNLPEELATSYRYKADNLLILEKYGEALSEINESIRVLKDAGKSDLEIMPAYNTRGNIYKYMKRFDDALSAYKMNYELSKKGNIDRYLVPSLGNIGHVYRLQKKYKEAIPYMLEAINIIKKSGNTQNLWENYLHVADSYEALGQFEKALTYHRLYSEEEFEKKSNIIRQLESELQIKYETAKKDETIEVQDATISQQKKNQLFYISIAALLAVILIGMYFSLNSISKKRKALKAVNDELELKRKDVEISNDALRRSLDELKSAQSQLIQSEKMASLGELTAGIAHEIQNPLNFVNNFSEVNEELLTEMKDELDKGNIDDAKAIANDAIENQQKILHHGKRADAIVKGMLQHSRSSSGVKEPTDINALADEYLRLAYHGLRAKDKSFNAMMKTDFDETIGKINIIPQDMGRVILNLINNAFYAVDEKKKTPRPPEGVGPYDPAVSVSTKKMGDKVLISVQDNGNGMPQKVLDKIFQPFFTTKPTGQGTGLGLSLSYDIMKAHGGEIMVATREGEGTEFTIELPTN